NFDVIIYESKHIPGGKARSLPVPNSGVGGRGDLPAEHGFRFFPGFYKHLPDTMKRIPFKAGSVFDNLVQTTHTLQARVGEVVFAPARFPKSLEDLHLAFQFLFGFEKKFGIPEDEINFFICRLLVLMTSCEQRRRDEYEKTSWWDFIGANGKSESYKRYL